MPSRLRFRCYTILRPLRVLQDGAVALEFALLAPVFFLIIMGTFELGLVMFYSTVLEGATSFGSRIGKVNYLPPGYNDRATYIRTQALEQLQGILPPEKLTFSMKTYNTFDAVSQPEACLVDVCDSTSPAGSFTDTNGNGQWDPDQGKNSPGAPGAIVQYELSYNYRFFTPFVGSLFADPLVLRGITVVSNEPVGATAR